jgi:Uncharacterized protein conserved in bacteria (DUF2252)
VAQRHLRRGQDDDRVRAAALIPGARVFDPETVGYAHARSGDAATITGYLGRGARLEDSISAFAASYTDQVAADCEALVTAVESGRVTATSGL